MTSAGARSRPRVSGCPSWSWKTMERSFHPKENRNWSRSRSRKTSAVVSTGASAVQRSSGTERPRKMNWFDCFSPLEPARGWLSTRLYLRKIRRKKSEAESAPRKYWWYNRVFDFEKSASETELLFDGPCNVATATAADTDCYGLWDENALETIFWGHCNLRFLINSTLGLRSSLIQPPITQHWKKSSYLARDCSFHLENRGSVIWLLIFSPALPPAGPCLGPWPPATRPFDGVPPRCPAVRRPPCGHCAYAQWSRTPSAAPLSWPPGRAVLHRRNRNPQGCPFRRSPGIGSPAQDGALVLGTF